jgi:hypothetical protein
MRKANEIPVERLREVFSMSPETGFVTWRSSPAKCVKIGSIVGVKRPTGHLFVQIDGKAIALHRVVWAMHYGSWPDGMIDHINRDPKDNSIGNLRIASKSQNAANIDKLHVNNKTGYKGVSFHKQTNKYRASISFNGDWHHLGLFETPELAYNAYVLASSKYNGEYSPFN